METSIEKPPIHPLTILCARFFSQALRPVLAAKSGRVKDPSKHVDIFSAAIWDVRNTKGAAEAQKGVQVKSESLTPSCCCLPASAEDWMFKY